jgi:hypothetical protein
MKENGSKIAIVSFSSHVSTLRALGQFDPYRSKEAAKLKWHVSDDSWKLSSIVHTISCGGLSCETATSCENRLRVISRVERSKYAGYFLSLISPPLVVL